MRKRPLLSVSAACVALLHPGLCLGFDLVRDGAPTATIITPDSPSAIVLDAAECLNTYVERISGVRLPVVPEADARGATGPLVVLGAAQLTRQAGLDPGAWDHDGYVHKVVDNKLFIAGRDEAFSDKIRDSGNPVLHKLYTSASEGVPWKGVLDSRGTLNGVIRLLQDHCGVRWFIPTPNGEHVPRTTSIAVPDDLDRTETPAFTCAFARNASGRDPATRLWVYEPGAYWAAANSFRIPMSLLFLGGHSWNLQTQIFAGPLEGLFELHPEYFSWRNGRRALARQVHSSVLCTSNPEVVDFLTLTMQRLFEQGWDMVQYNQSDGYSRCKCPRCEALDGYRGYRGGDFTEPCERLFVALNEMAKRCAVSHPGKTIISMMYGPTKLPSHRIDRFPGNVVFRAAHNTPEDFARWRGKGRIVGVWLYWLGPYMAPGVSVKCTPRCAAEKLRLYHAEGVRMLYWGMGSSAENWGGEGPVYYVIGQLMRNPAADYRPFLKEYYTGVYGRAAAVMEQYFTRLYDRLDALFVPREWEMKADEFFPTIYTPEFLAEQEGRLTSAKALARETPSEKWLIAVEDHFAYVKTTANVLHACRALRRKRDMPALTDVRNAVDARNRFLDLLKSRREDKDFLKNWYPGHAGFLKLAPRGRKNRSRLGVPFDWDFSDPEKLLRELPPEPRGAAAQDKPAIEGRD